MEILGSFVHMLSILPFLEQLKALHPLAWKSVHVFKCQIAQCYKQIPFGLY